MRKIKYLVIIMACLGLTSCGIFKKGCGCPHFGQVKSALSNVACLS